MDFKKVDLFFGDSLSGFEAESHDDDTISISLTDYEHAEDSTGDHEKIVPRCDSEVFLSVDEAESVMNALKYLINEDK